MSSSFIFLSKHKEVVNMNVGGLKTVCRSIARFGRKHATKLLAGAAIASEMLGFWFMHKEAPIVQERLSELPKDAKFIDKLKAAGPVYLPAFGMLLLSCGCVVGGCAIGESRVAIATGLYSASEAALRRYEEQAINVLGKEKAQEIHDAVANDIMNEKPVSSATVFATGKGDQLFYDPMSGRYFTTSKLEVESAVNRVNRQIIDEMWVTINDWYSELNLEPIGLGEGYGWNVDHRMDIYFSTAETPDQRTCYVIGYANLPTIYK